MLFYDGDDLARIVNKVLGKTVNYCLKVVCVKAYIFECKYLNYQCRRRVCQWGKSRGVRVGGPTREKSMSCVLSQDAFALG